jgi:hypothetical protein
VPRFSDQSLFHVEPYPQLGHVQPLTVILTNQQLNAALPDDVRV